MNQGIRTQMGRTVDQKWPQSNIRDVLSSRRVHGNQYVDTS